MSRFLQNSLPTGIVAVVLLTVLGVGLYVSFLGQRTLAEGQLVIYSGRSESLVRPMVEQFREQYGVDVQVRYGGTAQLSIALHEEGRRSPADLFWAQDRGALAAMESSGMLAALPEQMQAMRPEGLQPHPANWIATSGRARVLAYSPERVEEGALPTSVFDLTEPEWRGRVGWAPTNASFQSFVTAMRTQYGDAVTRQWLSDMHENQARSYGSNVPILHGIASGEIDLGLNNHYYLLRLKETDADFPVAQTTFDEGDIGNMVNVAGVGILASSERQETALQFIAFLMSPETQQFFASEIKEYPVVDGVVAPSELLDMDRLLAYAPTLRMDEQDDLQGTLALMTEVGVL